MIRVSLTYFLWFCSNLPVLTAGPRRPVQGSAGKSQLAKRSQNVEGYTYIQSNPHFNSPLTIPSLPTATALTLHTGSREDARESGQAPPEGDQTSLEQGRSPPERGHSSPERDQSQTLKKQIRSIPEPALRTLGRIGYGLNRKKVTSDAYERMPGRDTEDKFNRLFQDKLHYQPGPVWNDIPKERMRSIQNQADVWSRKAKPKLHEAYQKKEERLHYTGMMLWQNLRAAENSVEDAKHQFHPRGTADIPWTPAERDQVDRLEGRVEALKARLANFREIQKHHGEYKLCRSAETSLTDF